MSINCKTKRIFGNNKVTCIKLGADTDINELLKLEIKESYLQELRIDENGPYISTRKQWRPEIKPYSSGLT